MSTTLAKELPQVCDSACIREYLGVCESWFNREVNSGNFPKPRWKFGHKRQWSRDDVRQYLQTKELRGR
jgi:predicted DNA-binding transcriptional regulator AlpA